MVAFLEKNGIKKKRILAVLAIGEEGASAKGCHNDPACLEKIYQENRRVDFKIVGAEYQPPKTTTAKKTTPVKKVAKKNAPAKKKK